MKILIEKPPNYNRIKTFFVLKRGTIFTYGDTIYNPDGGTIDEPLMVHEEAHSRQQGDKPRDWWNRYFVDSDFRASQEVEAYQMQYREGKKLIKDRNRLFRWLCVLAEELSSPLYGSIMSKNQAIEAIKSEKLYRFKV